MNGSTTRLKARPSQSCAVGTEVLFLDRFAASSVERRQDLVDRRVVPRLAAHVAIGQLPVRPDHEDAAELPGVSLDRALARAGAQCAERVPRQARRQDLDATAPQPGRAIGAQLGIHEQRAVELEVLAKGCGKVRRPVSDDDQLGSASANLVDPVAQLRDLLAAEQSAEVADEDEHDRSLPPERAEPLGSPFQSDSSRVDSLASMLTIDSPCSGEAGDPEPTPGRRPATRVRPSRPSGSRTPRSRPAPAGARRERRPAARR